MKKEDLLKLGIDEENAKKAADAFADYLKGFIPKTRFDEVNEAKKTLEATVADRDKQLDELKKIDAAGLQAKIDELQATNKTAKDDYEKQIKEMRINHAIETALTAAKAKNLIATKALIKMDEITIEGDTIKGLDKQIKALSEAEDTKFLFGETPKLKGANVVTGDEGNPTDPTVGVGASFAAKYNAQFATKA